MTGLRRRRRRKQGYKGRMTLSTAMNDEVIEKTIADYKTIFKRCMDCMEYVI